MLPVFIWRDGSFAANAAKTKPIKMIRGATWWLEDTTGYEIMGGEQLGPTHAVYLVERRPTDWIGDDYLETVEIPYRVEYATATGVCDRVGDWYRFIASAPVATVAEATALAAGLGLPGFSAAKKG